MRDPEILLTIKLNQQLFVDPKRIRLLQAIMQTGSISQAAKLAKVSYKSAWDHLDAMHQISPKPLFERNTGGKNGGGTQLTPYAVRLLQLYDLLEYTQAKAFEILADEKQPLDNLLSATARFSLQSSARNQLFGKILSIEHSQSCRVQIQIEGLPIPIWVNITPKSAVRLNLVIGKDVLLLIKAPNLKLFDTVPTQKLNCLPVVAFTQQDREIALKISEHFTLCAVAEQAINYQPLWVYLDPDQIILVTL